MLLLCNHYAFTTQKAPNHAAAGTKRHEKGVLLHLSRMQDIFLGV